MASSLLPLYCISLQFNCSQVLFANLEVACESYCISACPRRKSFLRDRRVRLAGWVIALRDNPCRPRGRPCTEQ